MTDEDIINNVLDSDCELAARGLIYSGPRQVTGLVQLVKVSISA
jgi:hypothetical protein